MRWWHGTRWQQRTGDAEPPAEEAARWERAPGGKLELGWKASPRRDAGSEGGWRYVLGVHMRKETHSDYFLNPSTVLCIQLGAVATGIFIFLLSFFCAFSQGLSERIAQLEVIFIFLILVLIIQI